MTKLQKKNDKKASRVRDHAVIGGGGGALNSRSPSMGTGK
eukprot:CAMPEP_0170508852 /NCGR_PEP_ID=MMETSP0208-20121228/63644_1 /TAXON_ID=197538 /ORGANISM="Strombidium inclinatum, Strain S3" /LENGTH=39 /DNA_ID= /DNA_START= /DNA_END= /DNA_ORIENTATION=